MLKTKIRLEIFLDINDGMCILIKNLFEDLGFHLQKNLIGNGQRKVNLLWRFYLCFTVLTDHFTVLTDFVTVLTDNFTVLTGHCGVWIGDLVKQETTGQVPDPGGKYITDHR